MAHNEKSTDIRSQEDPAMLPMIAFDKENLSAMQMQVLEGMTQPEISQHCSSQGQSNMLKGPVKRQVAKAWEKVKSNEDVCSKTLES